MRFDSHTTFLFLHGLQFSMLFQHYESDYKTSNYKSNEDNHSWFAVRKDLLTVQHNHEFPLI